MKFCSVCKRLIPKHQSECPICGKAPFSKDQNSNAPDKRRGFVRVPLDGIIKFQAFSCYNGKLNPPISTIPLKSHVQYLQKYRFNG